MGYRAGDSWGTSSVGRVIALPLLLTYSEGETEGRPNEETERAPTRAIYEWELFLFSISYRLSLDREGTLRMGRL